MVVGLVGGIGAGKSTVAALLRGHGARVIDADRLGHGLLREPGIRRAIARRWGRGVLDARGRVRRERLAALVFAPGGGLAALNRLVHPRLRRLVLARLARAGRGRIVVLDAALLFELGLAGRCAAVVYVAAPASERTRRLARRGWSPAERRRREAAQGNLAEKRKKADFVLDNGRTPGRTKVLVRRLWRALAARVPGQAAREGG